MRRTQQYKRRVPRDVQGVVIDGIKLTTAMSVSLKGGMTKAKAMAYTEDLILRARARINYKLDDKEAWQLAIEICEQFEALKAERGAEGLSESEKLFLVAQGGGPDARWWLRRMMGKTFSLEDEGKVAQWVERVRGQKLRVELVQSMMTIDDPEALMGLARASPTVVQPSKPVRSVRAAAGRTPRHSELTEQYFAAKKRSKNYKRALEQFREQCGDLEVHEYDSDHCWKYRNWLNDTLDEKKGERLAGQTKNHKLSAARSLFDFAVERRYRNDNPMRDVKVYGQCRDGIRTVLEYSFDKGSAVKGGKRQDDLPALQAAAFEAYCELTSGTRRRLQVRFGSPSDS
jgi:hypothetical protein